MVNVYLLLGSNLGDRAAYLQQGIQHIESRVGQVVTTSDVYRTQSWGNTDAPDYLNQVILIHTDKTARQVLNEILAIELLLGRKREEKWGSRTLDIDILFYGDQVINEPDLIVPHPHLHNRRFTMEPLAQIAPDLIHPILQKDISQLKNELTDTLEVKKN
ncbi:2-amino-4-hydroxy-6-hydroxymethyldihydropteridine diphosphokinase [Mucilaginibacter daejeonensis]|uniref:2-amino-4-hydroxy-6- hydroxymethyldihydropteridine diphosphokinase n=1 Tax=Mucilaginibacter daejeonensis TaxID=398049 RepID=UPI001D17BD01|nr:2-amino-4-hydroxy-6-hydroxymethyldihydropteridine diphosphokinase [Mucilaginibacter daejeonensis]UEG52331.1 2-amino-4-hydroxy-6-hydroxymethyldihydropteridine diphosphokinase [Mucilaginibacter daejeonensis]